jgi:hypothetical protein
MASFEPSTLMSMHGDADEETLRAEERESKSSSPCTHTVA